MVAFLIIFLLKPLVFFFYLGPLKKSLGNPGLHLKQYFGFNPDNYLNDGSHFYIALVITVLLNMFFGVKKKNLN